MNTTPLKSATPLSVTTFSNSTIPWHTMLPQTSPLHWMLPSLPQIPPLPTYFNVTTALNTTQLRIPALPWISNVTTPLNAATPLHTTTALNSAPHLNSATPFGLLVHVLWIIIIDDGSIKTCVFVFLRASSMYAWQHKKWGHGAWSMQFGMLWPKMWTFP